MHLQLVKSSIAILCLILCLASCQESTSNTAAPTQGTTANKSTASNSKRTQSTTKTPTPSKTTVTNKTGEIANGMDWLSFDDVAKMGNKDGKKYLVDVYTSWCGWCKVMDRQTFTNPDVQSYVDQNFHPVKFDAEQKEPIGFKGKQYEWTPGGRKGVNKLAVELLGGRMSYPSLVYLDAEMNKIRVSPGFKKPDQLLAELKGLEGL